MLPGWNIDADFERDWLCVRIGRLELEPRTSDRAETELADTLMRIAAERSNHRLIVEFSDGLLLSSMLAGQLVVLHKRVHLNGGILRLCGLSDFNRDVLRLMGVLDRFQLFANRAAAGIA